MYRRPIDVNVTLLVVACLLLSIILFQLNPGKPVYGSMTVTGGVVSNPRSMDSIQSTGSSTGPQAPLVGNGNAFTYQGRLLDGGNPANGNYDFQFSLFDDGVAGSQVGSTLSVNAQAVSAGLFTVSLDFGATAFLGEARWLQIAVRQTGGGGYTILSPRQSITTTPYASSAPWFGVSGKPAPYSSLRLANTNSTLDGASTGYYNSTTVGADGLPLVSYYYLGNGDLRVAHCSTLDCTSATTYTLDTAGTVGQYNSITMGADGLGLISYYDVTNADLKVAHCSNTVCSSATLYTLDSTGNMGQFTAITLGSDGLGLISYRDATVGGLKVAHCSNVECSSATISTLDTANLGGQYTSVTVGADGLGLISYDTTVGTLKVAHCSNILCTSATIYTLDPGDGVAYTSITMGADGLGLISYYDTNNQDLKVAHCSNVECNSATVTILDSVGVVGRFNSITVGVDGLGLISYEDYTNGALKVAHCSDVECSAASMLHLDSVGTNSIGVYTSISIGADGLPMIGYYDVNNQGLRLFHCASPLCLSYQHRR